MLLGNTYLHRTIGIQKQNILTFLAFMRNMRPFFKQYGKTLFIQDSYIVYQRNLNKARGSLTQVQFCLYCRALLAKL